MTGAGPAAPLSPLEALLDQWARVCLPYLTAQTCSLAGLGVFAFFCLVKWSRDRVLPSTDDCLRVALTTVTLLTAAVAVFGLLLPTPPAPPELNDNVLRAMGLAVAVALFSYAGRTLGQIFSSSKREES